MGEGTRGRTGVQGVGNHPGETDGGAVRRAGAGGRVSTRNVSRCWVVSAPRCQKRPVWWRVAGRARGDGRHAVARRRKRTCHVQHHVLPAGVLGEVGRHVVDATRDDQPAVAARGVLGHLVGSPPQGRSQPPPCEKKQEKNESEGGKRQTRKRLQHDVTAKKKKKRGTRQNN